MKKVIFRCWANLEDKGTWELLEAESHFKARKRPRFIPRLAWRFLLNRIVFLEAKLEVDGGYLDEDSLVMECK